MTIRAFFRAPGSQTYAINCTTASSAALEIPGGGTAVRICNSGTVPVFITTGDAQVVAAVFPVDGTPQIGTLILPGVTEVFSERADGFIRAITASGTATIYLCRGEGI